MKEVLLICGAVFAVVCGVVAKDTQREACYWVSGESWEVPAHCLECGGKLRYILTGGLYVGQCEDCDARISLPDSAYPAQP